MANTIFAFIHSNVVATISSLKPTNQATIVFTKANTHVST